MIDTGQVYERLMRRFPPGARPELRMALYRRLDQLVEAEGEAAYCVIATVAADAAGKREPGKYFAFVVLRRLMERGLIPSPVL